MANIRVRFADVGDPHRPMPIIEWDGRMTHDHWKMIKLYLDDMIRDTAEDWILATVLSDLKPLFSMALHIYEDWYYKDGLRSRQKVYLRLYRFNGLDRQDCFELRDSIIDKEDGFYGA